MEVAFGGVKIGPWMVFMLPTLTICKLEGVDNIPREWFTSGAYQHLRELSLTAVSILPDWLTPSDTHSRKSQPERLKLLEIWDDIISEVIRASLDVSELREV